MKMASNFTWGSALKLMVLLLYVAAIVTAFYILPVEKMLKDFLVWIEDLGPWGPIVLTVTYIPVTILAVPSSILTLGGGYLFGLPIGFLADSVGTFLGASAAFFLGRTIGRSYVLSKFKDYPKFTAFAKVTPVSVGEYMLASFLGMMPTTFAYVYIGTTLKDISDVIHGWNEFSNSYMVYIVLGLVVLAGLLFCATKVAKGILEKVLADIEDVEGTDSRQFPVAEGASSVNLHEPLIIKIDSPEEGDDEK